MLTDIARGATQSQFLSSRDKKNKYLCAEKTGCDNLHYTENNSIEP